VQALDIENPAQSSSLHLSECIHRRKVYSALGLPVHAARVRIAHLGQMTTAVVAIVHFKRVPARLSEGKCYDARTDPCHLRVFALLTLARLPLPS